MLASFLQHIYQEEEDPKESRHYEWDLITIAERLRLFQIESIVYAKLYRRKDWEQWPEWFRNQLKSAASGILYQNMLLKSETDRVLEAFERQAVEVILLKGVYLSLDYFGGLGVRPTSDIDLLVRKKDLYKIEHFLKELGFQSDQPPNPEHFHTMIYRVLDGVREPIVIELHWNITDERTSTISIDKLWEQSQRFGESRYIKKLSFENTLYSLCLHGANHKFDSYKYILDIVHMFTHEQAALVDLEAIFNRAEKDNVFRRVNIAFSLVESLFPGTIKKECDIRLVRSISFWDEEIIVKARMGRKGISYYLYTCFFPLYVLDRVKFRTKHLFRRFLPSIRYLRWRWDDQQTPVFRLYLRIWNYYLRTFLKNCKRYRKKNH